MSDATDTEPDELGLGRLRSVDPRTIWKSEPYDFTPWLLQHLDVLSEALGIEIVPSEREASVGSYSLDLLGQDPAGRPVIIENQLEATNHTHLGQLLVYAAGLDAAVVIWVSPSFEDEHRQALEWLNQRTDEDVDFFGVELQAVQIGDSTPAPVFRLAASPNRWQKAVKRPSGISEMALSRHDFFESVMGELLARRPTFRRPKVGFDNWVSMASGPFGYYAISFSQGGLLRSEVYLDTGEKQSTKAIFDGVAEEREKIEQLFPGERVRWERLDERRASRVAVYREAPDLRDTTAAEDAKAWAADALLLWMSLDTELRGLVRGAKAEPPPA